MTPDDLDEVLRRCWNWPGIARAIRAGDLADGLSESALESVSRLVIVRLRLPLPELQRRIGDEYGRPIGRTDFLWPDHGVAGEADGKGKYRGNDLSLLEEKAREEDMSDLSLVITRWGWADQRQPMVLRRKIESAFLRAAARDRAGIPRRWTVLPRLAA